MTLAEILHAARLARRRDIRRRGTRADHDTRVGCWMCGLRTWRRVYTWESVAGEESPVRTFGRCPGYRRYYDGHLDPCRGTMHAEEERLRVLRAALRWDRDGHNRASEYDA